MHLTPLVSIVIPTRNRAHTVGAAIHSCLVQTVRDFEIIVVDDDGSTDDIASALAPFRDPRIRLIDRFRGTAAAARNGGAQQARGKYVAFLDSDDEFLPHKLERCLDVLDRLGRGAVYSQTYVDRGVARLWIKPSRGLLPGESIYDYLLLHKGWVHPSTIVLDADIARAHPFREDLRFGDDTQFAVDLCRAGVPLRMIEEPLAIYHDTTSATRLSQAPTFESLETPSNRAFVDWIESQRPFMSRRTYDAYRAWFLARFVGRQQPRRALGLLWSAHRTGSLSTRQAAMQAIQIFMPHTYRRLADLVAWQAGQRTPPAVAEMRARRGQLARA